MGDCNQQCICMVKDLLGMDARAHWFLLRVCCITLFSDGFLSLGLPVWLHIYGQEVIGTVTCLIKSSSQFPEAWQGLIRLEHAACQVHAT